MSSAAEAKSLAGGLSLKFTLSNGVEIPRVGFGTWQLKAENCQQRVGDALRAGYQLIDTASAYNNEEFVGDAIREYMRENPEKDRCFITSKVAVSEMGFDTAYASGLARLRRLGIEQLDLLLLHFPGNKIFEHSDGKNNAIIRYESWKALEKLYEEGKVRAIGVSNYMSNHLEQLLQNPGIKVHPMLNQVEFHPKCQNDALEATCKRYNIALQAYSSLGVGTEELLGNPIVKEVAVECGKTSGQVLLRWGLERNFLVLPRTSKAERVYENFEIGNFSLLQHQIQKLNALNEGKRYCWDPTKVL